MNRTKSNSFGLLALIGICGLLSACGTTPKTSSEYNVEKRNKVELVRLTHDVDFNGAIPGTTHLTAASAAALDEFLAKNNVGHADEVSLDLPTAKDADAVRDNLTHRRILAAYLAEHGLTLAAAATPYGADPKAGTARLVIGRYVVTPPACPDWSKRPGADYQNRVGSNYGCATESALGLMVANPHDLIAGQSSGPARGIDGATAIQHYNESAAAAPAASSSQSSAGTQGASAMSSGASSSMTPTGN